MMQRHVVLLTLASACLLCINADSSWADPHPLGEEEKYLQPFLEELVDYRDNPIARRYIAIANLVDAVPTWIEDLLIPLFIPGSTLTIPINAEIPLGPITIGPIKIPLPAHIKIVNLTMNDLNEFKSLRPLKLQNNGRFTWAGVVDLKETTIVVNTELVVLGHAIDVVVTMPLTNPAVNFTSIIAYNRTRLCDVWGKAMHSSATCAVWPFANHEALNVSGVNLTDFHISVSDFDFSMHVTGLGSLNKYVAQGLEKALMAAKPKIIRDLPGIMSQTLRAKANDFLLHGLPKIQQESPCDPDAFHAARAINVSRVCFANNGGYDLKWKYHNCPAHLVSSETPGYPIDQKKCMDVKDVFPEAVEGQVLRVATQAIAGIHEIIDPGMRYVPNSNAVGFECSGSTLSYHCDFLSVAPIDPSGLPQVSEVCVINHAGFVMYFDEQNIRTQSWMSHTDTYPIDQTRCIDLASTDGAEEGDKFQTRVHAIGGKTLSAQRQVEYRSNRLKATFECTGTTLNYDCSLLAVAVRSELAPVNSHSLAISVNSHSLAIRVDQLELAILV